MWFGIVGSANLAFALLHLRLPKLGNRWLAVPGQAYWLATPERKSILVDRLRGISETALLCLNILFLAIYQTIYQHHLLHENDQSLT